MATSMGAWAFEILVDTSTRLDLPLSLGSIVSNPGRVATIYSLIILTPLNKLEIGMVVMGAGQCRSETCFINLIFCTLGIYTFFFCSEDFLGSPNTWLIVTFSISTSKSKFVDIVIFSFCILSWCLGRLV